MSKRFWIGIASCGFVLGVMPLAQASVIPTSCSEEASAYNGTLATHNGLPTIFISSSSPSGEDYAAVGAGYTGPNIGQSGAALEISGQVVTLTYLGSDQAEFDLGFTLDATQPYTVHAGVLSGPNGILQSTSGDLTPGSYTYTANQTGNGSYTFDLDVIAVPEPVSFAVASLAGCGLLFRRRRTH